MTMAGGLLRAYENITIEEYERKALDFFKNSIHPILKRSYLECIYLPMVDLLHFLEASKFQNYIVTGGGRDFTRIVSDKIYGIPADHVIGSSVALEYEDHGEYSQIVHKAKLDLFDDGPVKPVRIWSHIGKRPVIAVGNSNGDIPMLHFCHQLGKPSLALLLEHDDEKREFKYNSGAEESLEKAKALGWSVISMKNDWSVVFPDITRKEVAHHPTIFH